MTPERWRRVRALIESVLDRNEAERSAILRSEGDAELNRMVEDFLSCEERGKAFDLTRDLSLSPCRIDTDEDLEAGRTVGPYRICAMIAHGGMGTVYRAVRHDRAYDKQVAIKVIKRGLATNQMRRRFQQERQTLADLDHPYVTRLLDGGTTEGGLPYLVMEYVVGRPIDQYCDQERLALADRLDLFGKVCEAVQYAHQNLIVHRDLKPGNILVTYEGVPKLLDFGISKLLQGSNRAPTAPQTLTVGPALTPVYSSPEQIRGEPITTASDVYSLGVILYELLTGCRPHPREAHDPFQFERAMRGSKPLPPSEVVARTRRGGRLLDRYDVPEPTSIERARRQGRDQLRRRLRGDLDNIALKALHQDPKRRYVFARELSEDIRRYRAGLPVLARPDTFGYRLGKFVRRNKGAAAALTLAVVAMAIGTIGTGLGMMRARVAQQEALLEQAAAIEAKDDAQETLGFLQDVLAIANPYREARDMTLVELLAAAGDRVTEELNEKPYVEAGVRLTLARAYAGLWRWPDAVPHLRTALELNRRLHGDENHVVADCLCLLGRALTFARNEESVDLQTEALSIRRKLCRPDDPRIAESMGNLGYALWYGTADEDARNWDGAAACYSRAIRIYRAQEDHLTLQERRDLARFTFSFAVMRGHQHRLAESNGLFRDALQLYRALGGSDDRYMTACMEQYAATLSAVGRFPEAESLLRESLKRTPEGLSDQRVFNVKWRLAGLRRKQHDPASAESIYRDAWVTRCRRLAKEHPYQSSELTRIAEGLSQGVGDGQILREAFRFFRTLQATSDDQLVSELEEFAAVLPSAQPAAVKRVESLRDDLRRHVPADS